MGVESYPIILIRRIYGDDMVDMLRKILKDRINDIDVKQCEECGNLMVWCPICECWHHLDCFNAEHIDTQETRKSLPHFWGIG